MIQLLIWLLILICPPRSSQAEWSRCVRGRRLGGAAGAAKGVGPWMALHADPWSNDVAREVAAQPRPKVGASPFGFFWVVRHSGDCQKKLARKARNKTPSKRGNEENQQSQSKKLVRTAHPTNTPPNTTPKPQKSHPTKNPPKRVFLRPSQHPVGSHHGNGRSSLILEHSLCPSDSYRLSKPLQTEKAISEPRPVSISL